MTNEAWKKNAILLSFPARMIVIYFDLLVLPLMWWHSLIFININKKNMYRNVFFIKLVIESFLMKCLLLFFRILFWCCCWWWWWWWDQIITKWFQTNLENKNILFRITFCMTESVRNGFLWIKENDYSSHNMNFVFIDCFCYEENIFFELCL